MKAPSPKKQAKQLRETADRLHQEAYDLGQIADALDPPPIYELWCYAIRPKWLVKVGSKLRSRRGEQVKVTKFDPPCGVVCQTTYQTSPRSYSPYSLYCEFKEVRKRAQTSARASK